MRRFAFSAVDAGGTRLHGIEIAADEAELDRQLSRRGLVLVSASPTRARGRITPRTLIDLFYHLSVVLASGVPVLQALRDLQESGTHPLAAELAEIERRVGAGTSLSEAFAAYPEYFSPLVQSLVRAGEKTGELAPVLHDLVGYLEWREELRRQVRSAITYPVIVLLGTVGLCSILAFFVLPRFTEIFGELGVAIPTPMRAILFARHAVVAGWLWLLAAGTLLTGALWYWQRSEHGREARDRMVLRTPLLGRLALSVDLSRFCRNLALLYSTGFALLDGLRLTMDIVQNRVVRRAIDVGIERVQAGAGLRDSLGPEQVFPPMVLRMLHVGESTGHLDEALKHVARFYDREVPETIDRSIAWFNSGVLVFMGMVIIVIALSFFLPLYETLGSLGAG